jgi:hypothetical protein
MIETTESTVAICQYSGCGNTIEQIGGRGHRPKVFCSDRCRQRHHREEEERQRLAAMAAIEAAASTRIEALERELAEAHQLIDDYIDKKRTHQPWKKQLQERWLQLGKAADWPALTIAIRVPAGERAYRVFGLAASNELLEEGNVTLRRQGEERQT